MQLDFISFDQIPFKCALWYPREAVAERWLSPGLSHRYVIQSCSALACQTMDFLRCSGNSGIRGTILVCSAAMPDNLRDGASATAIQPNVWGVSSPV